MAWIKVDDHFDEHPKFAEAGPLGVALWLAGMAYCGRNLTDGFIPWSTARSLLAWDFLEPPVEDGRRRRVSVGVTSGMSGDDVDCAYVIELLVNAGLWEAGRDGYIVHDYPLYQPSRAEVLKERRRLRTARSAAGKRGAARRYGKPASKPDGKPDGKPVANRMATQQQTGWQNDSPVPVPVSLPEREKATDTLERRGPGDGASGPSSGPLLTAEQLAAWETFRRSEWQPFREAWLGRGLLWPPSGTDEDDDTSQRGLLWQVADARPTDLGRWVTEARGRSAREVIAHVLTRWHAIRDAIEDPPPRQRRSGTAAEPIGDILPRVVPS